MNGTVLTITPCRPLTTHTGLVSSEWSCTLGSVAMPAYTERLIRSIFSGRYLDRRYVRLKLDAIRKREAVAAYDRVVEWLQPALAHAKAAGVTTGDRKPYRNRNFSIRTGVSSLVYGDWRRYDRLLARFRSRPDSPQFDFDRSCRMAGRDVPATDRLPYSRCQFPARDHRVPFSGMIDFATLIPSLPFEQPMVWELSSSASKDDIVAALTHWKQRFSDFGV